MRDPEQLTSSAVEIRILYVLRIALRAFPLLVQGAGFDYLPCNLRKKYLHLVDGCLMWTVLRLIKKDVEPG